MATELTKPKKNPLYDAPEKNRPANKEEEIDIGRHGDHAKPHRPEKNKAQELKGHSDADVGGKGNLHIPNSPVKADHEGGEPNMGGKDNVSAVHERHAKERSALHKLHETERRDLHGNHREEHRQMHVRHEKAHKELAAKHEQELADEAGAGGAAAGGPPMPPPEAAGPDASAGAVAAAPPAPPPPAAAPVPPPQGA